MPAFGVGIDSDHADAGVGALIEADQGLGHPIQSFADVLEGTDPAIPDPLGQLRLVLLEVRDVVKDEEALHLGVLEPDAVEVAVPVVLINRQEVLGDPAADGDPGATSDPPHDLVEKLSPHVVEKDIDTVGEEFVQSGRDIVVLVVDGVAVA